MSPRCSVLISSAGRRVALMRAFKRALSESDIPGSVIATDISPLSSAFQLADSSFLVPSCTEPDFVDVMIEICEKNNVRLIIPTIDTELPVYAGNKEKFSRHGIVVNVSSPETIEIAGDKRTTNRFLRDLGVSTVRQESLETAAKSPHHWNFPVIAKPALGSSGVGVRLIMSQDDLVALSSPRPDYIVESHAAGYEVTVDVFVLDGRCILRVPRRRLEVRGGEVSKGVTMRHPGMMSVAQIVSEALPGAFGVLNVQLFHDPSNDAITVSEINARFGGGFPLSLAAGALCPSWLVQLAVSRNPSVTNEWTDNLTMLRYDDAVFIDGKGVN